MLDDDFLNFLGRKVGPEKYHKPQDAIIRLRISYSRGTEAPARASPILTRTRAADATMMMFPSLCLATSLFFSPFGLSKVKAFASFQHEYF
jgi:hypothetical protein